MNKQEHISFWLESAKRDWKVVDTLLKAKKFVYSLFFAHLVLEKLCKAHWIKDNESNYPPKIHNLNKIVAETKLNLSETESIFLADINKFQLEGRYQDYVSDTYKLMKASNTLTYIKQCNQLQKKLTKLLPSK